MVVSTSRRRAAAACAVGLEGDGGAAAGVAEGGAQPTHCCQLTLVAGVECRGSGVLSRSCRRRGGLAARQGPGTQRVVDGAALSESEGMACVIARAARSDVRQEGRTYGGVGGGGRVPSSSLEQEESESDRRQGSCKAGAGVSGVWAFKGTGGGERSRTE